MVDLVDWNCLDFLPHVTAFDRRNTDFQEYLEIVKHILRAIKLHLAPSVNFRVFFSTNNSIQNIIAPIRSDVKMK